MPTGRINAEDLNERMVHLIYEASLGSLNLDGGLFEDYCLDLLKPLEETGYQYLAHEGTSLIDLFTEESPEDHTNLGLIARARLLRLRGWRLLDPAGTDPAQLNAARKLLEAAYAIAEFWALRRKGNNISENELRKSYETLVLTIQGVVSEGLVRSQAWHRLLDVPHPPWPADDEWERFVRLGHGSVQSIQSLWHLCGVARDAKVLSQNAQNPSRYLSKKVQAVGLRTLALYIVVAPGSNADSRRRAARLCLWAAQLNEGEAGHLRVRNVMEAGLVLRDEWISDIWGPDSSVHLTQENLTDCARRAFRRIGGGHPDLDLYLMLLNARLRKISPGRGALEQLARRSRNELEQLAGRFDLVGAAYLAQLARDLIDIEKSGR